MEILEERGLSFLFPLLRIQNDLWKHIQNDPSSTALYKWVKDNVDEKLFTDRGFIHILASRCVHVSGVFTTECVGISFGRLNQVSGVSIRR